MAVRFVCALNECGMLQVQESGLGAVMIMGVPNDLCANMRR